MTLLALFRRALAAIGLRCRRAPASNAAPGTRGRSLFDSPAFQDLVREHAAHRVAVPRMADLLSGGWYVLRFVPGRECKARDWINDYLQLQVYLPQEPRLSYDAGGRLNCRYVVRFPGRGFIRAAAIMKYLHGVSSCPDVLGIVTKAGYADHPVPAVITEDEIAECQMCEAEESAKAQAAVEADQHRHQSPRKPRKRGPVPPPPSGRRRVRQSRLTPFQNAHEFGEISIRRAVNPQER